MKKIFLKNIFIFLMVFIVCLTTGCSLFKEKDKKEEKKYVSKITSQATTIETKHFKIEIAKNVYVPGYLADYIEILYDSVEKTSGLSFYNERYNPNKIKIIVNKIATNDGIKDYRGNPIVSSLEDSIIIGSGDLMLGNGYALVEGLSKMIQLAQSNFSYSQFLQKGYSSYITYKTLKYLEENYPDVARVNGHYSYLLANNKILEDENNRTIYDYSIEYWIDDSSLGDVEGLSLNGTSSIGMRFMRYLEDTYDSSSKWFVDYESQTGGCNANSQCALGKDNQIQAVKNSYGNDALNGFYDWMKENDDGTFDGYKEDYQMPFMDTTKVNKMYLYPDIYTNNRFQSFESTEIKLLKYNNLIIDIDELRNYLSKYQGKDVSNLTLKTSKDIRIELFNSNGKLLARKISRVISLKGVGYVNLYGEGTLGRILEDGTEYTGLKIVYKQSDIEKEEPLEPEIVDEEQGSEDNPGLVVGGEYNNFKYGKFVNEGTHSYKYFAIRFNSNMYLPGYFEDYMKDLFDTMEVVMGVDYDNSPHSSKTGVNDNIVSLVVNSGEACFVANSYRDGYICEEDLLFGNSNNLLRTMIKVFDFVETRWDHNDLYEFGADVYSMYKIMRYLEVNNIPLSKAISNYSSKNLLADYVMYEEDYTKLMAKDIEYWIRNLDQTLNVTGKGYFSIGIRFMAYLDNVYEEQGGYLAWLRNYEIKYPYSNIEERTEASIDSQIQIMKDTYGEDVFANFYSWLNNNKNLFDYDVIRDYTQMTHAYLYPLFSEEGVNTSLVYLKYKDLYISIDETRNYLRNYKGKDVNNMKLKTSDSITIGLYDAAGNLIKEESGTQFSISNVAYIKLVGEGMVEKLEIIY